MNSPSHAFVSTAPQTPFSSTTIVGLRIIANALTKCALGIDANPEITARLVRDFTPIQTISAG
jgi:hypothetical protein